MLFESFRKTSIVGLMLAAALAQANAQTATFVVTPPSLAFGPSPIPQTQTVSVTLSTANIGQQAFTTVACPTGLTCSIDGSPGLSKLTPFTLTVTGSAAAGTGPAGIGLQSANVAAFVIPVTLSYPGGGGGTGPFSASPTSLTFNQSGNVSPSAQTITVFSNSTVIPNYVPVVTYLTGASGWLSVTPTPGILTSANSISVIPNSSTLVTGTYTANLTLTPSNGVTAGITIPITLSVNQGTGTGSFTVTPNPIVFSYAAGVSTPLAVTATVSGASVGIIYTATLTGNAAQYVAVPSTGTTGGFLQLSLQAPSFVPAGTTGTLTISAPNYTSTSVPVQINPSSGTTGSLISSPSSLSFTGVLGAPVTSQSVTVQSGTPAQPSLLFYTTITSNASFLTVTPATGTTPTTLTIGIDPSAITAAGTYTGTITLSPYNGATPTTLNVTYTVTGAVTVTPDPTSVAISGPLGTNILQQKTISLTSPSSAVPFVASSSTTSGGVWLGIKASSSTFPATVTVSANPSGLAVGTYSGSVVITTNGLVSATIPVTLTITPSATIQATPATLSFNYQTTATAPPAAQSVSIASTGATGVSFTATPTTTSGGNWLLATPATGTTPGSVSVSVNPTGLAAGTYSGNLAITSTGANNSPQNVPVTLVVTAVSTPQITSVVNAASFGPTQAVPGLIVTLFGKDMGPATLVTGQVSGTQLVTSLAGTKVLFDNIEAPIVYTSATQISAVVPYEIANRFSTRVQVQYNNLTSTQVELRVGDTAPGLFSVSASGTGQAAVLNQNSSVNGPANPESRGRVVVLYATGEGATNPQGQTGHIVQQTASDLRIPAAPVVVRFGDPQTGTPGIVQYVGSAPGFVSGALQVNVLIPANAPTGTNVPVYLQVGSNTSQPGVTVAIQ